MLGRGMRIVSALSEWLLRLVGGFISILLRFQLLREQVRRAHPYRLSPQLVGFRRISGPNSLAIGRSLRTSEIAEPQPTPTEPVVSAERQKWKERRAQVSWRIGDPTTVLEKASTSA